MGDETVGTVQKKVVSFDKGDPAVGTGMIGVPGCGVMRVQIRVAEERIIEAARFTSYGCGSVLRLSARLSDWIEGKTFEETRQVHSADLGGDASEAELRLAEDAIRAAIVDFRNKRDMRRRYPSVSNA